MLKISLAIIPALILVAIIVWILPQPVDARYNCSIAEISPDIPLLVKEECRKRSIE